MEVGSKWEKAYPPCS